MSLRRAVDALQRGRVGRVAAGGKVAGRVGSLRTGRRGARRCPCPSCPLHTRRTSPAQSPWAISTGAAEPNALTSLSHCHRRVRCPVCTGGVTRTERGWVTAVNGAPQLGLGGTVSLEERHGQAAV